MSLRNRKTFSAKYSLCYKKDISSEPNHVKCLCLQPLNYLRLKVNIWVCDLRLYGDTLCILHILLIVKLSKIFRQWEIADSPSQLGSTKHRDDWETLKMEVWKKI